VSRGRPRIDRRVREFVRFMYAHRLAKQKQLARFLGVSQSTVHRMITYD